MDEFIARWNFVRFETLEILDTLTDEQLQFKPTGDTWQPLFYQFGCIGRTQLVYAKAVESGQMDLSLFGSSSLPNKDDNQSKERIINFLEKCNQSWLRAMSVNNNGVEWPAGRISLLLHISSLAEHERLHHGQLISYFTLTGFKLPKNFKSNWAL
jgi:hypothetical protein